jgi:hypothetical protein
MRSPKQVAQHWTAHFEDLARENYRHARETTGDWRRVYARVARRYARTADTWRARLAKETGTA